MGGKNTLYHCVWCFASVSAFSHEVLGKMDFDCEQQLGKASKRLRRRWWEAEAEREI